MAFTCKECNREFNSEESLRQHSFAKHKTLSEIQNTKKNYNTYIYVGIFIILIIGAYYSYSYYQKLPGKYDDFAKCINEKGAKFYGTFWCPHCKDQKRIFGKSAKYLPYIECSTPNGKDQTQICKDEKIDGYPTWEFSNGTRISGTQTLEQLSLKTGCTY